MNNSFIIKIIISVIIIVFPWIKLSTKLCPPPVTSGRTKHKIKEIVMTKETFISLANLTPLNISWHFIKVTVNNFPKNAIIIPKIIYKINWKYGFIANGYFIAISKDVCTPNTLLPTKSAAILDTKAQINNFPLKYLCISSILNITPASGAPNAPESPALEPLVNK